MANIVNFEFDFGDEVYMKADADQRKRIITAMLVRPTGIAYEATGSDAGKWCYAFELTREKDVVQSTTN